jgi:hypothetical protein
MVIDERFLIGANYGVVFKKLASLMKLRFGGFL